MHSHSTSNFGFGLPKSYWDTPHPSKPRTLSSGVKRRSSLLDSPLRSVKRRRLSGNDPQKRRIEKNDNGFKFYWILDSPTTKGAPTTIAHPTRDDNPLRELSRDEWKERSRQQRQDSPDTDIEIIEHPSDSAAKSSPQHSFEDPSLMDVSFGQPLDDEERTRPLEPILESPDEHHAQSESKESGAEQQANESSKPIAEVGNGKVLPVVVRPRSASKRRKRDFSPSQIVRRGNKKYVRRHKEQTEKYVVHEVRRKKVKKLRKVVKKKKKKKPRIVQQTTRYPPMEIPNFPKSNFSKSRSFYALKDQPLVAVSKFLKNLNMSWIDPLTETYGTDSPTNLFGFIPRSMKKCIAHLNQRMPDIVQSCNIVMEDCDKLRKQKENEEKSMYEKETSKGGGSGRLPAHWYIDCLKSRRDNMRAYTDALQEEVKGFDDMWREIERPGFLDELFPQLRLELNFENSDNDIEDEKEDPLLSEWKEQDKLAEVEVELLCDELRLELKLENKELELEAQESEIKELHGLFGASATVVTKLNRVAAKTRQLPSSFGAVENDSVAFGDPSVSMSSRPRGSGFPKSDHVIISGFIQALERAQESEDMDVDF